MNNTHLIAILKSKGYCLWVGAGVGIYLAKAGGESLPNWCQLVEEVETEAFAQPQLHNFKTEFSLPERLDVSLRKIGRIRFQKLLRSRIHLKLGHALIRALEINNQCEVPLEVKRLGQLGMLANPIVNFNIETVTSAAIAGPGGTYSIKPFMSDQHPSVLVHSSMTVNNVFMSSAKVVSTDARKFPRQIYHPHGAIDISGLCVLTKSDYKSLEGTLAFQLAVHASFMSPLLIAGMSLNDDYLRNQIASFRPYIGPVIWCTFENPTGEVEKWALLHDVTVAKFESTESFWEEFVVQLPMPDELSLLNGWANLIQPWLYPSGTLTQKIFAQQWEEMDLHPAFVAGMNIHHMQQGLCEENDWPGISTTVMNERYFPLLQKIGEMTQ